MSTDTHTQPALEPVLSGYTAPGYEGVREAFLSNLRTGEDWGSSVAVYRHGVPVVDLTGGDADNTGAPYPHDSLHVSYSVTKGVLGLVLADLTASGALSLDRPVADYWPEFAAAGKARITVTELASHQAGLNAFTEPITAADLADWDLCVHRLARRRPAWEPGTRHGYHALALGYLLGEVIRRATGASVGQLLQQRFNPAGDLHAWIGLPPEQAHRVIACRDAAPTAEDLTGVAAQANATPGTATHATFNNPPISIATFADPVLWSAEIPAANGIFDARSLARLYSTVVDGPLRTIPADVVDRFRRQQVHGPDQVLVDQPTRFGTAFMLPSPRQPMLGPGSFGHDGMGGHLAFAHPESGIAFGYLTTRAVPHPSPHPRLWRLLAAVQAAL